MELLTVQETAAILRVSPATVRRYIASRRLPAVRVGRALRVSKEDVEGLCQANEADEDKLFTHNDPLWNLVGIAASDEDGPTDVSANKLKYLAEAFADLHDE